MDEREYFLPERVCDHYFEVRDEAGKLLAIYGTWHRADRFRDGRPWVITRHPGDFDEAQERIRRADRRADRRAVKDEPIVRDRNSIGGSFKW